MSKKYLFSAIEYNFGMAEIGRPTLYTTELAERICLEISINVEGLDSICNRISDFPNPSTVYLWRIRHEEFSKMYMRARQAQAQILADQIVELADNSRPGEVVTTYADGKKEKRRSDNVDRTRLQIDARKWLAMKLLPRIYGEKLVHEGNEDAPLIVKHIGK